MQNTKDGGPAFPLGGEDWEIQAGDKNGSARAFARGSYIIADAMLEARGK